MLTSVEPQSGITSCQVISNNQLSTEQTHKRLVLLFRSEGILVDSSHGRELQTIRGVDPQW